jgi:2-dehydro-3-deoxygluconokinase
MIVCFGEVLLRIGTGPGLRLADATTLEWHVGGAEANVAYALAGMGHPSRMLGVVPANPLGRRARGALAAGGVDTRWLGEGPGRMGLYWFEAGAGLRPSSVTYDRADSAFARAESLDFAGAFAGARLLHLSGITAALGPGGVALCRAAIAAARAAGLAISFDPNYRALLWDAWDSDPRAVLLELVAQADILFANHRDMTLLLGRDFGAEAPRSVAEAAFGAFGRLQVMASTRREVLHQTHHVLSARVDRRDGGVETAPLAVTDVVDRVGSGDAFAAGVLSGWLDGEDAAGMARLGLALGALKHAQHGDMLRVTRAEAFSGMGGDVRR